MPLLLFLFFESYCAHRDLHVLTHSFPTRRSSDLFAVQHDSSLTRELLTRAPDPPRCPARHIRASIIRDRSVLQANPPGTKSQVPAGNSDVLAAVDVDFRAVHVGRRLGAQEVNGGGDRKSVG